VATVIGLDDIRQEAEQQFGDLEITLPNGNTVRLRHALRLSKPDRKRLAELGVHIGQVAGENSAHADSEDALLAAIGDVLILVAETKQAGRALLSAIRGDLLTLMGVFRQYQQVCQLPEASGSTS
jgi:tail assembly protein